jgi:hypothetical protein
LRDASSRATKALYPALSLCDMIFSGIFEAILASPWPSWSSSWRGHPTCSRRWTTPNRERHGEAIYRFKDGMLPSDFFRRRNVVFSFQEDAIGIRLRDGHRCRQHDVGLGLSAQRVDLSPNRGRSWRRS